MPDDYRKKITKEVIFEYFEYDRSAGLLLCKKKSGPRSKIGMPVGSVEPNGYLCTQLLKCNLKVHRVIWFIEHGCWPQEEIDHIDGNKLNNVISNLRDVPKIINSQNKRKVNANNTSGLLGVSWHKASKKWSANIGSKGVSFHLGLFDTKEQAHAAYIESKRQLHEGNTL